MAALPSGWSQLESRDGDTWIGVAPGWYDRFTEKLPGSDLSSGGLDSGNPTGGSGNSELDAQLQQLNQTLMDRMHENVQQKKEELYAKGILFEAYNSGRPVFDEVRTHYLVQRKTGNGNWTWETAENEERKAYAFKPKKQDMELPIGKVLKLSASEELRNGSTVHRISYLAIEGPKLYILRFVTEQSPETISSVSDSVAQTWRIKPL